MKGKEGLTKRRGESVKGMKEGREEGCVSEGRKESEGKGGIDEEKGRE